MADVTKTLKDAFYVTVGLGVLSVREAKERRQALRKQVQTQLNDTNEQLRKLAKQASTRLESVRGLVETSVPATARDLVDKARQAAKDTQGQLQSLTSGRLNVLNRNTTKLFPPPLEGVGKGFIQLVSRLPRSRVVEAARVPHQGRHVDGSCESGIELDVGI